MTSHVQYEMAFSKFLIDPNRTSFRRKTTRNGTLAEKLDTISTVESDDPSSQMIISSGNRVVETDAIQLPLQIFFTVIRGKSDRYCHNKEKLYFIMLLSSDRKLDSHEAIPTDARLLMQII